MSRHFLIRVLPSERPRDASLVIVSALLPGVDLGNQCGAVWQAPIKALAIQDYSRPEIIKNGMLEATIFDK